MPGWSVDTGTVWSAGPARSVEASSTMRVSGPRVESHQVPASSSIKPSPASVVAPDTRSRRTSHTAPATPVRSQTIAPASSSSGVRSGTGATRCTSSGRVPETLRLWRVSSSRGSSCKAVSHAQTS